ncbi:succinate dehydrogenase assembly factor 2 [Arenicellales bacterium nBUS_45]
MTSGVSHNRLRWRARRGVRELDGLLLPFSEVIISEGDLKRTKHFDKLLSIPDPVLLDWFFQRDVPDEKILADLVREILDYSNATPPR